MVSFTFSLAADQRSLAPGGSARMLSARLASETEVLRLEVDQIDVLAGHGEERLDLLLEELLRLGETLAGGARTATAHFGPEPVELAVSREEARAHLTVLIHGMPPRLLFHRQALPLTDLLGEIAGLAREVAGRLLGGEPETTRLRRRLLDRATHLEGTPRTIQPSPGDEPEAVPALPERRRWSADLEGAPTLTLELDLSSPRGLLPSCELGRLSLGPWSYQGPLLPFLEALLEELNHALAVLDDGCFSALPLGEAILEPGEGRRSLRLGGQEHSLPVPRLLEAILGLFGDYLEARRHPPARVLEADEARRALLYRLRLDEVEGGLGRLAPAGTASGRERTPSGPSFGPGDLRHVGLRRAWVREHEFEGAFGVRAHQQTLAISGPRGQLFADARDGELRIRIPGARAALPLRGSHDFLVLETNAVERRRPDGALRWRRELAPLGSLEPVLDPDGLHLVEAGRHLLRLGIEDGAIRWRVLTATDPSAQRWLLRLGEELLLADDSGVVELFTAEGRCRLRGHLGLRPELAPRVLGDGRLLVLGRSASGELSVALFQADRSGSSLTPLAPGLARLGGVRQQGSRLLLWGPEPRRDEGEEILWSTALDGSDPRQLHRFRGPLSMSAGRGGFLAVDGEGRCLAPGLTADEGARLDLGTGPVSLLRFGNIVVAAAERLAVLHPEGRRVLGAIDLLPAEGPVTCCRGPGRSFSLVDEHGCLQRFAVAGHLSVI